MTTHDIAWMNCAPYTTWDSIDTTEGESRPRAKMQGQSPDRSTIMLVLSREGSRDVWSTTQLYRS